MAAFLAQRPAKRCKRKMATIVKAMARMISVLTLRRD
jgi:hypothetical protein